MRGRARQTEIARNRSLIVEVPNRFSPRRNGRVISGPKRQPVHNAYMRKQVLIAGALALAGCAYGEYKSEYLEEFASLDCGTLERERVAALETAQRISRKKRGLRGGVGGSSSALPTSASPTLAGGGVETPLPQAGRVLTPEEKEQQRTRMRNHARLKAILQLEGAHGCLAPPARTKAIRSINGRINHVMQVNPGSAKRLRRQLEEVVLAPDSV